MEAPYQYGTGASNHLMPPAPQHVNPEYNVPLTPAAPRPPFEHYHSSSTLPITPRTPYAGQHPPPPHAHPDQRSFTASPSSSSGGSPYTSSTPSSGLSPIIRLPTRLLLASISPALIPLVLTIIHLFSNRRSTADMADSLRSSMYAACTGLAKGAGTLQTIPRYMAMKTNEQMVEVTQAMIRATGMGLIHMVTVVETVVIFMIETYRSLLMCTIELAVRGTLELMIGAVRGISEGVTASLSEIRTAIQSSVSTSNRVIQEAVSRISRATSLIGIDISIPEFSIPALSRLENVTIPNDFEQSLVRLNGSIPSLDELRTRLNAIIQQPFVLLKSEMNDTRLELASSFNNSLLPTPPMSSLSSENSRQMELALCGDLDTRIVDDTAKALNRLSTIAIGLMFLLLFLCWAALCIWEWYRWKCLKDTVETVQDEWKAEGRPDAWRAVAVVENPVLERYGAPVLRRIVRKERARRNTRWYLSYLAHPTCLALLCISILGFLSLQLQLVALNALKSHAQSNADAAVTESTNSLTQRLNAMALEESRDYASRYNAAVAVHQQRLDERLIGHWVNTTGVALNSTLNEFYDDVERVIDRAFGNTPLHNPMSTFMYCILGSKIDSLSRALTWLRDNGRIVLPTVREDILMLSPEAMNEMASPITAAAVGSSAGNGEGDDDGGIVGKLIRHWEKAIVAERNFYAVLIGVWAALALIGLGVVLWNSGGSERFETWRESRRAANGAYRGGDGQETVAYDQHRKVGEKERYDPFADNAPIHDQYASSAEKQLNNNNNNNSTDRSKPSRAGTALGSLASLVAPADQFLRFGRKTPGPDSEYVGGGNEDGEKLVRGGESSEKYTFTRGGALHQNPYEYSGVANPTPRGRDDIESPPAFWIKKASAAALSPLRSFFPGRGQKHGQAIHRIESRGSDEYLVPTRESPGRHGSSEVAAGSDYHYFAPQPVYPRPMSRASTPLDGQPIVLRTRGGGSDPFDEAPVVPAKQPYYASDRHQLGERGNVRDRDSVDMLEDEEDEKGYDEYDYRDARVEERYGDRGESWPRTDSALSTSENARVEVASKGTIGRVYVQQHQDQHDQRQSGEEVEGKKRRNPFADIARI